MCVVIKNAGCLVLVSVMSCTVVCILAWQNLSDKTLLKLGAGVGDVCCNVVSGVCIIG